MDLQAHWEQHASDASSLERMIKSTAKLPGFESFEAAAHLASVAKPPSLDLQDTLFEHWTERMKSLADGSTNLNPAVVASLARSLVFILALV